MAVVIKSKSLQFLIKAGVSSVIVDACKDKGVKLAIGHNNVAFLSAEGNHLFSVPLPFGTNNVLSGALTYLQKKQTSIEVTAAANTALLALSGVVETPPLAGSPVASVMPEAVKVAPETVLVAPPVVAGDLVIPLREATQMYQKVRGTSAGSVYVVVALNSGLAVAARIHGTSLAVRAEPTGAGFTTEQTAKLKAQAINSKGAYASGHFECHKVPAGRVLGAVLLGLGLHFDTPLPEVSKVAAASK